MLKNHQRRRIVSILRLLSLFSFCSNPSSLSELHIGLQERAAFYQQFHQRLHLHFYYLPLFEQDLLLLLLLLNLYKDTTLLSFFIKRMNVFLRITFSQIIIHSLRHILSQKNSFLLQTQFSLFLWAKYFQQLFHYRGVL